MNKDDFIKMLKEDQEKILKNLKTKEKEKAKWTAAQHLSELKRFLKKKEKLVGINYHDYNEKGKQMESASVYYSRVAQSILKYISKESGAEFRLLGLPEKPSDLPNYLTYWNGSYWMRLEEEDGKAGLALREVLRLTAEKVCIDKEQAITELFMTSLLKEIKEQLSIMGQADNGAGWLNFTNGTLRIDIETGETEFLSHQKEHFLTHILPYEYDPTATSPEFDAFFSQMQPDEQARLHIWEFIGSCFLPTNVHGKIMIFHGESGNNGKSTFGKCLPFVLGERNISTLALNRLAESETARYKILDKLIAFGNENQNSLNVESDMIKVLGRGEPIEVRRLYHDSFETNRYARLACSVNKLPRPQGEDGESYYRRFLIIPWPVHISEREKIVDLERRLAIGHEAGILNHILQGLKRLIRNEGRINYEKSYELIHRWRIEDDVTLRWVDEVTLDQIFTETNPDDPYTHIPCTMLTNKELHQKLEVWCRGEGIKQVPSMDKVGQVFASLGNLSKGKFNGQRCWYLSREVDTQVDT